VLEARIEPGGGLVQSVAIDAEYCYLLDRQIALLL
jgi:hypothetical protein